MLALARPRTLWLAAGILLLVCAWIYAPLLAAPVLRIESLPVGKGTAYLVRGPGGALLLINTGSDAAILRALGSRLPPWQRSIAAVVLTDASADAAGGLASVLSRYQVALLVRTGVRGTASREQAISTAIAHQKQLRPATAVRGLRIILDSGSFADILWPSAAAGRGSGQNSSVALRISYKSTAFVIADNLPSRTSNWLSHIEQGALVGALALSSSTPSLVSDGTTVRFLK